MNVDIDANKILTTVLLAILMYVGNTVYSLDKEVALLNYKMEQNNQVLQMLSEDRK
jgi:hypothetical protein